MVATSCLTDQASAEYILSFVCRIFRFCVRFVAMFAVDVSHKLRSRTNRCVLASLERAFSCHPLSSNPVCCGVGRLFGSEYVYILTCVPLISVLIFHTHSYHIPDHHRQYEDLCRHHSARRPCSSKAATLHPSYATAAISACCSCYPTTQGLRS